MEIININKKSGINTSSKMLQLLVNSWCRNIKYSTIDLAMILDEIGVAKFLPGSSELLSGTLSLLHESLTKCSNRCSCSSPAILSKTLARDLTLFFGLHHSNTQQVCDKIVDVFWKTDEALELKKRLKVLSIGFKYAGLIVNLDKESWITLEYYQRQLFPFNQTMH